MYRLTTVSGNVMIIASYILVFNVITFSDTSVYSPKVLRCCVGDVVRPTAKPNSSSSHSHLIKYTEAAQLVFAALGMEEGGPRRASTCDRFCFLRLG